MGEDSLHRCHTAPYRRTCSQGRPDQHGEDEAHAGKAHHQPQRSCASIDVGKAVASPRGGRGKPDHERAVGGRGEKLGALRKEAERAVQLRAERRSRHSLASQNAFWAAGRLRATVPSAAARQGRRLKHASASRAAVTAASSGQARRCRRRGRSRWAGHARGHASFSAVRAGANVCCVKACRRRKLSQPRSSETAHRSLIYLITRCANAHSIANAYAPLRPNSACQNCKS